MPTVTLAPAWLAGRTVKEFRISREGARALVISEQNGKTRVQVTGIIRTADGTPRDLTAPITLLTSRDPDQGVWVNDTTVAVMKGSASENVTPELLSLTAAQPQQLAPGRGSPPSAQATARRKSSASQRKGSSSGWETAGHPS